MERLLITGAAGGLGTVLRERLKGFATTLRLSDKAEMPAAGPGEEVVQADIADFDAVKALVEGCDGIIHLGGQSREGTWESVLNANIKGCYNVFEAARQSGKPRIIFASSNHAIGFHTRETRLDGDSAHRPDSLYGLSKCFGEDLGALYWDKFGVESVAVRIGSCFEKPMDRRMLATWLSFDDFAQMCRDIFAAPRVAHTILYGASANKEQWWDNGHAAFIGWRPRDSAEAFRAEVEAATPRPDPNDPAVKFHGGGFAKAGHFED